MDIIDLNGKEKGNLNLFVDKSSQNSSNILIEVIKKEIIKNIMILYKVIIN